MPNLNPLGLVKDATGTATHLARGAAGFGLKVAGTVGGQVIRRVPGVGGPVSSTATSTPTPATEAYQPGEEDVPEPVNVVEELDLDPAPVEEADAPGDEPAPVTDIDAQADPDAVDVTPADVAEQVERSHDQNS